MNKRIILLIMILAMSGVLAANPGHTAASVSPGTFNTGDFVFPNQLTVNGNFVINTDTLFINATSGNVGIGTNTPTSKLYVEGNITVNSTSDICIEGGACLSDGGSGNITGSGTTNTIPLWTGSATLSNSFFTQTASAINVGADLIIANNNFIIDTNTFFVNATSNRVGINTNNPQATLDVNGSIALNNNNITNVECITFASGGEICST